MSKELETLSELEFFERFRAFVSFYPSKKDAAKALKISESYVGDLFHGRRTFSDAVLKKLGFVRRSCYVQINSFLKVASE